MIRNGHCLQRRCLSRNLNGVRVCACGYLEDKVFQEVGTANVKVLKQVLGATWRPVCLSTGRGRQAVGGGLCAFS